MEQKLGTPSHYVFVPLAILTVANMVGVALSPYLLVKEPLALMALSPLVRHLVVVAPQVDAVPFFIVAVLRLFAADPFLYVLGRDYGPRALDWLEARSAMAGRAVRLLERLFMKAGLAIVFLSPGLTVCTLAGVVGLPVGRFVAVNLAGTVALVLAVRWVGGELSHFIALLTAFVERHLPTLTLISIGVTTVGWLIYRYRTRRNLAGR